MTIEKFLAILLKRWWLVLLCTLAVGAGAYIGSKSLTRLYQSSALIQITIGGNNNQLDYNNLLASEQLVETEAQLATSNSVLRSVAAHYHGLTPTALAREVTTTSRQNTQVFEIDVVDASPTRAAALANDIAAALIKQQFQVVQQANSRYLQGLGRDLDAAQQQINAITNQITTLQAQGGNQAEITGLQISLGGLYQWQTTLAELQLNVQNSDYLSIVQPAEPNPVPVQPNVLLNTVGGLLVGLLLGMLLAVLLELFDKRIRTPEALTRLLGWPLLATVWYARSSKKEQAFHPTRHDANVESYRMLRTNIVFLGIGKPVRCLLISSALPREGKSTIAANLAIFMARAGKNTLLVDADLRHPILGDLFDIPLDRMGLSNALLAFSRPAHKAAPAQPELGLPAPGAAASSTPPFTSGPLEPFVHSVGIANLRVMPSGPLPPNSSELLESNAMGNLFKILRDGGAEVVIFDSPPLLDVSDASILASRVDGALVVVDITRADKASLMQVKARLSQAGTHVLGCVANKGRHSRKNTGYAYSSGALESREAGYLDTEYPGYFAMLPAATAADPDGAAISSEFAMKDQSEDQYNSKQTANARNALADPVGALDANARAIKFSTANGSKESQGEQAQG